MIYRKYNFNKFIDLKSLNYDLISKYIENVYNIGKLNFINNYDHYENDYLKNQKLTYTFYIWDYSIDDYYEHIKSDFETIIKIYLQNKFNLSNKIHYFLFDYDFHNNNNLAKIIEEIFYNDKIQKIYNNICKEYKEYFDFEYKEYLSEMIFGPKALYY